MKDGEKLTLAQRIFSSNYIGLNDLGDILSAIYEDGYMDNGEESLLKAIAERDSSEQGAIFLEPQAQDIAHQILSKMVFSKNQFDRFLTSNPMPIDTPQTLAETRVELNSVTPLENGAYLLQVHLYNETGDMSIHIETPDSNGTYILSENFAGFEDPLESHLRKFIADEALARAYQDSGGNEEIRKVMDTVGRIGKSPIQEDGSPTPRNMCHTAEISDGRSIHEMVEDEMSGKKLDEHLIYGIRFRGPMSPALEDKIEKTMAKYPDYLVRALASFNTTVVLFDSAEIYTRSIDEGVLLEPPQSGLSWTRSNEHYSTIYLDLAHAKELLMHELFHTLAGQIPSDVYIFPRMLWLLFLPPAGASRLYGETRQRIKKYEEDAFTTDYQSVSAAEYFADGVSAFYGKDIRTKSSGSVEEMMEEDPLQYLMFVQMDSLLEYHYGPIWAAFTETAIHRANSYLAENGNNWKDPENLRTFRDGSVNLDITQEMEFWKAFSEFHLMPWQGAVRMKRAFKKLQRAAKKVLETLPDFSAAKRLLAP